MEPINLGLLVLRIALGVVFIAHGAKHYRNKQKTENWTRSMGFTQPTMAWFFMTFAELGVGVGLIAGLLTTVAAAGVVALLSVAYWTVHRAAGFWITARPDEGWEYVMVLIVGAVSLALLGPGEWSVDDAIGLAGDLDGWVGLIIALAGIPAAAIQLATSYRPSKA